MWFASTRLDKNKCAFGRPHAVDASRGDGRIWHRAVLRGSRAFAMSHAEAEIRRRGAVPEETEDTGSRGELARREVGRVAYEINVQQYACAGLNFGTYTIARRSLHMTAPNIPLIR
jgi:hypothetical protein